MEINNFILVSLTSRGENILDLIKKLMIEE